MQLGDLRRRITIESQTLSSDANGQEIITWGTLAEVWARMTFETSMTSENGGESVEADQRVAQRIVKFTIRFRDDVDATCRILYDSKYYFITGVEQLGRERFLTIKTFYADRELG